MIQTVEYNTKKQHKNIEVNKSKECNRKETQIDQEKE